MPPKAGDSLPANRATPPQSQPTPTLVPRSPLKHPPRVGPQIVNSGAITKVGDPDWENMLASENFTIPTDTENESTMKFRPMGDANSYSLAPIESETVPFIPLPKRETPAPIHKQPWQSDNVAKRRQILMLATIAITGSLLAIGCFVAFMKIVGGDSKPAVAKKETLPTVTQPVPEVFQSEIETQSVERPVTTELPLTKSESDPPPPNIEIEAFPSVVRPTLEPSSIPAKSTSLGETEKPSEAPLKIFNLFGDFLNQDNSISDAGFGKNESPDELDVQNATIYVDPVFHPMPKSIPSWDERSKLQLSSFKSKKDMSIIEAFDLFGRMTGVGITVDWQSCRIAGIDLTKKLQLDVKAKSIAEVVTQIVESNGLVWTIDNLGGLPIVSAPLTAMESKLPKDWSVSDLFPQGSEQQGCDVLLRLWGYDDVCRFANGGLQWNERATPVEKANAQASLQELASQLKLNTHPLWQRKSESNGTFSPTEWHGSLAALARKVPMSVIVPERRPIPELLTTAARETNLNVFIDWPNAWAHGLIPNEPATALLGGRTFSQVANRFLTDYALELIPISEDSFWITTGDVRRKMIRVVPIRRPKDVKLEDLMQSLRLIAPLGPDDGTRFRVQPVSGADDLFWARVCTPRADQLNDPDLILSFGWPNK